MVYEESLSNLINEFKKMPSIGIKTAQRLAFYVLRISKEDACRLADAIIEIKEKIRNCSVCGNITESEICNICRNPKRDKNTICVVEEPRDILVIEKTGVFKGLYHCLMGAISPLDGIGPDDLRIKDLMKRLEGSHVAEVIIATDPNTEGEATATYLAQIIKPLGIKISRIARGLPMGMDVEYADEGTLSKALEGRMEI
ncbi:recombination protein RecR [bacterium]|nr:recombination protein RecR [bacterium]